MAYPGDDLVAAVRKVLVSKLELDADVVDQDYGTLDTRRIVEPQSKIKDEVVVEFPTAANRDAVKSCGFKLEGQGQNSG